ncbi:response regulator [Archangium lansingense]|uniref:Response regulator n=1 Tax=Archangium lansingense TaxID=2995310 RepID=A0ABT4A9F7_9BACT|nr:response regulator [Archangium lansinium]MCY1077589.1 response regulator [Archangium lansinium]
MSALKRILLVEDSENDVTLILAAFAEAHLADKVVVANDGQEALDYLYRQGSHSGRPAENPAVVLLDLKLPRVDGLQVLGRMKSDPDLKLVPVVMFTSSREEVDLVRSYSLGANAYVIKPVSFLELESALEGLRVFWTQVNEPPPDTASVLKGGE